MGARGIFTNGGADINQVKAENQAECLAETCPLKEHRQGLWRTVEGAENNLLSFSRVCRRLSEAGPPYSHCLAQSQLIKI